MEQFSWVIGLLITWFLVCIAILTGIVIMDFLFLGRRGRLDWIANLFRREKDEDK